MVSSEDDAPSQEPSEASFYLPTVESTSPPPDAMPPVSEDFVRNPGKRPIAHLRVPDVQEIPSGRVSEEPVSLTGRGRMYSSSGPSPQGRNSSPLPCFSITPEGLKQWVSMDDDSRQGKVGHDLNEVSPVPLSLEFFW